MSCITVINSNENVGDSLPTINANFQCLDTNVDLLSADVATNTTNIAANSANIGINAANIATNTTNIAANSAAIIANTNAINGNNTDIASLSTTVQTNSALNWAAPASLVCFSENLDADFNPGAGTKTIPVSGGSVWSSPTFDQGSNINSGGAFIAPYDGLYEFTLQLASGGTGTDGTADFISVIYKNLSPVAEGAHSRPGSQKSTGTLCVVILSLVTGDWVVPGLRKNTNFNQVIDADPIVTFFQGKLLTLL